MRNERGQFVQGHIETPQEKVKRINAYTAAIKNKSNYLGDIIKHRIYNSWRAIMFNEKGKRAGICEDWKNYRAFYNDVIETWKPQHFLNRLDKKLPFSKDNFIWLENRNAFLTRTKIIKLAFNGEEKTMKEWADELNLNYSGVRQRYHKCKEISVEEVLFGIKPKPRKEITCARKLAFQKVRDKASKMCSTYKHTDSSKRLKYDLSVEWVIENIFYKKCVYCGTNERIGCDRLDNSKGHSKDNVVPCCYSCNVVRGDRFSFDEMKKIGQTLKQIYANRN